MSVSDNASYFSRARVIPILTVDSVGAAVTTSGVLLQAGLRVLEVTLRTAAGLDAVAAVRRDLPALSVGAGSVLTPELGEAAIRAGAQFLVSPGTTEDLLRFALRCAVPFLPGAATISELMELQSRGCTAAKVFPVESLGGVSFIRSIAGPLPGIKLCPTGGINADSAPKYLDLPNVIATGGSWMVPETALAGGGSDEMLQLARHAASL